MFRDLKERIEPKHKPLHAPDPGPPRDKPYVIEHKPVFDWYPNKSLKPTK